MQSARLLYAAFMLLAAAVFLFIRWRMPKNPAVAGLPRMHRFALAAAGFVGGVFAAKLPFLIGADLSDTLWLADGKTITTGLIGAYLAVEGVKLLLGVKVKTGDSFALPLAAAIAIGRWGCFFNGCCFGAETTLPWGVDFGDGLLRHPTQIYESLFHLSMAAVVLALMKLNWLVGHRLQLYLIAYSVYRFITEFIRPEPEWAGGLTFYQWAAAVLGVGLTVQWLWEAGRRPLTLGAGQRESQPSPAGSGGGG